MVVYILSFVVIFYVTLLVVGHHLKHKHHVVKLPPHEEARYDLFHRDPRTGERLVIQIKAVSKHLV